MFNRQVTRKEPFVYSVRALSRPFALTNKQYVKKSLTRGIKKFKAPKTRHITSGATV